MKVPATSDSLPRVHLSFVSSQIKVLLVDVPRSISIPPSCVGEPVSSEFKVIIASPIFTVFEFTVVVVPETVKLPATTKSLNSTLSVVAIAWPILIVPLEKVTPVPPDICALTSAAEGPVYVMTPVVELYANEPSPPASVTDIAERASELLY